MRGVNKVIIVGNLGRDPEERQMPSGTKLASFSVATTEQWKDRESGEQQSRTEWHRVVFFGRIAEVCLEYLRKGSQVYIEGSLRTRKWTDKEGNDRYSTEIVGREMQMLGGRGQGSGRREEDDDAEYDERPRREEHSSSGKPPPAEDFDDDIPF